MFYRFLKPGDSFVWCCVLNHIIDVIRGFVGEVGSKHVVVVLLDGLGTLELELPGFDKFVCRTVFPSSTPVFMYTLHSLLPPEKHGFLEWYMRFRNRIISVPPWHDLSTDRDLVLGRDVSRSDVFPFKSLSEHLVERGFRVTYYNPFPESTMTRAVSGGAVVRGINFLSQALPIESSDLTMIYWHSIDVLRHERFLDDAVRVETETISLFIRRLAEKIPGGTKLYVITDHGLTRCVDIVELPEINNKPPVGGGRVAFYKNTSKSEVEEKLAEKNIRARVYRLNEVFQGEANPKCYERYGEVIVIAEDNICFKYPFEKKKKEDKKKMKAAHGGLSRDEILVNVWVYERK